MDSQRNPFFELYAGDRVDADDFVTIFSPFLVGVAESLFSPGNVVLQGTQGSGKSMLLSLIKSDLRKGYAKANLNFPVDLSVRPFIGATINLSTCGVMEFGDRPVVSALSAEDAETAFFADYINYWLALDMVRSVEALSELEQAPSYAMGVDFTEKKKKKFVSLIRADDCWLAALNGGSDNWDLLLQELKARVLSYRRYLSFNSDDIDEKIAQTKTRIGEPISAIATAFLGSEIVPEAVSFFVNVDQYEELANLDNQGDGQRFRRVINRALANRTSGVSYRIGTRKHAWMAGVGLDDTGAKIEEDRNYKIVDIDLLLRRKENATWLFPAFAKDVFTRRLSFIEIGSEDQRGDLLKDFLGTGLSPEVEARHYTRKGSHRAVKLDKTWPPKWCNFLLDLANENPLSAKLAEAWARQKGAKSRVVEHLPEPPYPWDSKVYWRKERIDHALMQIAGRCAQRRIWAGQKDVIELSGSNILVFLSLCQKIWARGAASDRSKNHDLIEVDVLDQAIAIFDASEHWFNKILNETGQSRKRYFFVSNLGSKFYKSMYEDLALSYPGHNGFSLSDSELENFPELRSFLRELSDYGNLFETAHRTKEKDRQPRTKWYLHPILCPRFRIPHVRVKEPIYARPEEIAECMREDSQSFEFQKDSQLSLFGGQEDA